MPTQKHIVQNAALSRGQTKADRTASSTVSSASNNIHPPHRESSFVGYDKTGGHSTAMARCVEWHRHLLAAIDRFARKKPANGWTPRAATAWLGLAVSQIRERSARRQLVRLKAADRREAEQKVLYLIAATVAQKMDLQPAEIVDIAVSVEDYRADIVDLLQARDT